MRPYLCIASDSRPQRVDFDRPAELFAEDEERAPAEAAPASAWVQAGLAWRETAAAASKTLALLRRAANERRGRASRAFSL